MQEKEQEQWYTTRDLFEMMQSMQKEMSALRLEMQKTSTLIRDYNGLRQKLDECEKRIDLFEGKNTGSRDMWGYLVGAFGILVAIVSFIQ